MYAKSVGYLGGLATWSAPGLAERPLIVSAMYVPEIDLAVFSKFLQGMSKGVIASFGDISGRNGITLCIRN